MATATLTIDLAAIAANWHALAACAPGAETGAVVKADAYGLGVAPVARALAEAGARRFFVAVAEEGATLRRALGPGPEIWVFSGHMAGDTALLAGHDLIPLLNSGAQLARHRAALPGHAHGIQLNTGMNRLGMDAAEFTAALEAGSPRLIISHLACADAPGDPMNTRQLARFHAMTDGLGVARSLAATGGLLLGPEYHFDICRPGIGLYGGLPFASARPVVRLDAPVVQIRHLDPGEAIGYSATWTAREPRKIATLAAGYCDGLTRSLSNVATLWAGDLPCPLVGRVSMDLITVDVTGAPDDIEFLTILGPHQGLDALADSAGTIGYEILTSLGARYRRLYTGGNEAGTGST